MEVTKTQWKTTLVVVNGGVGKRDVENKLICEFEIILNQYV